MPRITWSIDIDNLDEAREIITQSGFKEIPTNVDHIYALAAHIVAISAEIDPGAACVYTVGDHTVDLADLADNPHYTQTTPRLPSLTEIR